MRILRVVAFVQFRPQFVTQETSRVATGASGRFPEKARVLHDPSAHSMLVLGNGLPFDTAEDSPPDALPLSTLLAPDALVALVDGAPYAGLLEPLTGPRTGPAPLS